MQFLKFQQKCREKLLRREQQDYLDEIPAAHLCLWQDRRSRVKSFLQKMRLKIEDVELFYKLYWSLLFYANQRYKIIKNLELPDFKNKDHGKIAKLQEKLCSDIVIINSFIANNPFNFNQKEICIIKNWKNFIKDKFFVVGYSEGYAIFLGGGKAYGVVGLYDELKDLIPNTPTFLEAVLLPFKGKIIYSGIMNFYNIQLGPGFEKSLKDDYHQARNKFGFIVSLEEPIDKNNEIDEKQLLEKAIDLEFESKYEDALKCVFSILSFNPNSYHALFLKARINKKKGNDDIDTLKKAFEEAIKQDASKEILELFEEEMKYCNKISKGE